MLARGRRPRGITRHVEQGLEGPRLGAGGLGERGPEPGPRRPGAGGRGGGGDQLDVGGGEAELGARLFDRVGEAAQAIDEAPLEGVEARPDAAARERPDLVDRLAPPGRDGGQKVEVRGLEVGLEAGPLVFAQGPQGVEHLGAAAADEVVRRDAEARQERPEQGARGHHADRA
ncbi:MAG TPA: hypothetical protein VFS00_07270, partial [Polyangiaceae bacterium]|nr:hypothetical protein [Polyangiaceae bacterium]